MNQTRPRTTYPRVPIIALAALKQELIEAGYRVRDGFQGIHTMCPNLHVWIERYPSDRANLIVDENGKVVLWSLSMIYGPEWPEEHARMWWAIDLIRRYVSEPIRWTIDRDNH